MSAFDPLTGASTEVVVQGRGATRLVVRMALSDSPRLLLIDER